MNVLCRDVEGLERALAVCLQQIFQESDGKPMHSLAPSLINDMMETLTNGLTQYGLQNLKTGV